MEICILSCSASDSSGDIQSSANVEENANQRPAVNVTANIRRWRWNGRRPGTAGTESFFQNASSSFETGDVSEMAASHINCAKFSTSGRPFNASQSVKIVIAEITIGAISDGRKIWEFNRMWFLNWTCVNVSTILRTVICASGTSCINDGTLV